jgi:hypothetical protein
MRRTFRFLSLYLAGGAVVGAGFELVFFRQGEQRPAPSDRDFNPSVWRIDDLYLANLALTDIDGRAFHSARRDDGLRRQGETLMFQGGSGGAANPGCRRLSPWGRPSLFVVCPTPGTPLVLVFRHRKRAQVADHKRRWSAPQELFGATP